MQYVRPVFEVKRKSSTFDVVLLVASVVTLIAASIIFTGIIIRAH